MEISAIDIKKLWYGDTNLTDITAAKLKGLLNGSTESGSSYAAAKEIKNVHQDTWQLEESEPSQDGYRNQLTGKIYRMGRITEGELVINFTIGKYDFALKSELMGGTVIESSSTEVGWKRSTDSPENMYKSIIALTVDDVYVVLPKAAITTREANTDKAIGLAVKATMMEPDGTGVSSEYWYTKSAVDDATAASPYTPTA